MHRRAKTVTVQRMIKYFTLNKKPLLLILSTFFLFVTLSGPLVLQHKSLKPGFGRFQGINY